MSKPKSDIIVAEAVADGCLIVCAIGGVGYCIYLVVSALL